MSRHLSDTQVAALGLLADGPVNDALGLVQLGASRQRTMRGLERLGYARYAYTSELWHITAAGRKAWRAISPIGDPESGARQ